MEVVKIDRPYLVSDAWRPPIALVNPYTRIIYIFAYHDEANYNEESWFAHELIHAHDLIIPGYSFMSSYIIQVLLWHIAEKVRRLHIRKKGTTRCLDEALIYKALFDTYISPWGNALDIRDIIIAVWLDNIRSELHTVLTDKFSFDKRYIQIIKDMMIKSMEKAQYEDNGKDWCEKLLYSLVHWHRKRSTLQMLSVISIERFLGVVLKYLLLSVPSSRRKHVAKLFNRYALYVHDCFKPQYHAERHESFLRKLYEKLAFASLLALSLPNRTERHVCASSRDIELPDELESLIEAEVKENLPKWRKEALYRRISNSWCEYLHDANQEYLIPLSSMENPLHTALMGSLSLTILTWEEMENYPAVLYINAEKTDSSIRERSKNLFRLRLHTFNALFNCYYNYTEVFRSRRTPSIAMRSILDNITHELRNHAP